MPTVLSRILRRCCGLPAVGPRQHVLPETQPFGATAGGLDIAARPRRRSPLYSEYIADFLSIILRDVNPDSFVFLITKGFHRFTLIYIFVGFVKFMTCSRSVDLCYRRHRQTTQGRAGQNAAEERRRREARKKQEAVIVQCRAVRRTNHPSHASGVNESTVAWWGGRGANRVMM